MKEFTHIKINLEKSCFITMDTSIESVKERIEFLRESCIKSNITSPKLYDSVLAAIDAGNYEYLNMGLNPMLPRGYNSKQRAEIRRREKEILTKPKVLTKTRTEEKKEK